ncbi:MAG TPA: ComEC/Rec2 family competence protein [Sphaerochaeta sp.]|nr:ComEC/Rec2 family competence protein [Sphaerochaeta sp.]
MRGCFWVRLGICLGVPLLFFLAATESALLAYPLVVALALLLVGFAFMSHGYFFHPSKPKLKLTLMQVTSLCFFCYAFFGWAMANNHVEMAFIAERITQVEGILTEDSLLSKGGKQVLRLRLHSCGTQDGAAGSAQGVVSALVKVDETLVSGSRVTMQGELASDSALFFADTLQVLSISRIRIFRRNLLSLIERRLTLQIDDEESRALALMLLLGRTGDAAFPLKELSLSSGCAHLLALSGMHLQFFIMALSWVLVPLVGKRRGRVFSVGFALLYVLMVGPKPSLVRAMGMAIISLFLKGKMASYYSYLATACLQIMLFPSALSSMGSLFSYAAYGGLLCNRLLSFYRPRWMEPLFASLYAILFTAIPTLSVWGKWQIGALFIAPVASSVMFALMGCSLLVFIFGRGFAFSVNLLYRLLKALFSFGSDLFGGGLDSSSYVLYLLVVLTLLASIGYAERALQKRRRNSYELEIRVRFTEGNQELAR